MSHRSENKREYERYSVSLKVQVSAFDAAGELFTDTGILKDISGGGANLITRHASRYFIGQKFDLKICLPGSDVLKGNINGHGMVVWIGEELSHSDGSGGTPIGLCMDDLLVFDHLVEGS